MCDMPLVPAVASCMSCNCKFQERLHVKLAIQVAMHTCQAAASHADTSLLEAVGSAAGCLAPAQLRQISAVWLLISEAPPTDPLLYVCTNHARGSVLNSQHPGHHA